ncbi:PREDICTED: WD repeat-containing protein 73 [Charadrius vociferus]|uniref:WD repeat-containing protein 73 n=1 Tax=Charadrius vociferus TaxID=50402 RepID=UPI00052186C0|nr:PREDICTED: WD repeat-containing protein 73 [Charadrius vociferus]
MSSVPQGSLLGPVLFNAFVGDVDSGIEGTLSKFAHDTKQSGAVNMLDGRDTIQRDMARPKMWAGVNLIKFNKAMWTVGLRAPSASVCVAGYGQSGGNEILQLLPPPSLQVKETQGLCPERDFKVECGGFSNRPVYSLKYVPDTSESCSVCLGGQPTGKPKLLLDNLNPRLFPELTVTSGPPDSSLQVWQVSAEDSDVIKSVGAISTENATGQPWAKIATISARAPWVLHGSRLDSVQITEVESRKNVYMAASRNSEELSGLAFLDCNTLLLCCAKGQLCLADVRQPQSPLEAASVPSAPCGERWCMGVGRGPQGSDSISRPVARLSSGGHLTLTDLRKTSESLASAKCRVPSSSSGAEFLCVSWAPVLESCLAVSGFDGTVHVYDAQSWDSSGGEAEPVFVHKGHAFGGWDGSGGPPLVTAHTWHPQKPRTLLSAASDGSLHVWDWVQSCGNCG